MAILIIRKMSRLKCNIGEKMEEKAKKELIYDKLMIYRQEIEKGDQKNQILEKARQLSLNMAHREINSRPGITGKVIIFFKRVIRRCLKWYIDPVCEQQSEFNSNIIDGVEISLNEVNRLMSECEQLSNETLMAVGEVRIMKSIIEKRDKEIEVLEKEMKHIQKMVDYNEAKNDSLLIEFQKIVKRLERLPDEDGMQFQTRYISSSQSGEDCIINYVLSMLGYQMGEVTYLDLGANHAKFLSNTYNLYSQGARGVLVEANPQLIPELKIYRPGDIVLNRCIDTESNKEIEFYVINGDGLSTPSYQAAQEFLKENNTLKITNTVKVFTITVDDIMDTYFKAPPVVLNIDIEGEELEILNTISFEKYRPLIIISEMIPYRKELVVGEKNQNILKFMENINYIEYANTGINSIFIDKRALDDRGIHV